MKEAQDTPSSVSGPHPRLVRFGTTYLHVSRFCQGTGFRQLERSPDDVRSQRVLRRCIDVGVNFIDTAHVYRWGGFEAAVGKQSRGDVTRW